MTGTLTLLAVLGSASAGAAVARILRLPMWPMTGAVLGAAAFHLALPGTVRVPTAWVFIAQVAVGTSVGARLGKSLIRDFGQVVVPGLVVMGTVLPVGVGLGFLLSRSDGMGEMEAVFGMVPGGVGEMVAAVTALGGDSALVAGMHLARLLVVIWAIHLMVAVLRRRRGT
jgi:membrane AbrB-like protein